MTQLQLARSGRTTPEMAAVAEDENLSPETVREAVASGRMVIPRNVGREFRPRGIGRGARTKVNANIGTSSACCDPARELEKLRAAVSAGADSVMDLSTGGDLRRIRRSILEAAPVMVGSVPIYRTASRLVRREDSILGMTPDLLFETIEEECAEGVDYITVHCGVTRESAELAGPALRTAGIVSRGGSMLAAWMAHHRRENPLFEEFDRLLEIAARFDVTLSLGDGLRPGAIADATDPAQVRELATLAGLVKRAREAGVQTLVEGPGHVPLDQIQANVQLQKALCGDAPFYVLGPLTTDCAPGHDHITGAIGGALAAAAGADFLCYVTPAEHLCLPGVEDVRLGVVSARIAAHSGDIVKGVPGARERDLQMSRYRKALDWEGMFRTAIDPETARRRRAESPPGGENTCTMCGKLCAMAMHGSIEAAGAGSAR